jgi:formylglycine-generating enzyme required for sulfatase activity
MKKLVLILVLFLVILGSKANNLTISNVSLTGQNPASDYIMVQFDISWDNSWRLDYGPSNWDAAWVFIKFKSLSTEWRHAILSTNPANYTAPAGCTITPSPDGLGVFIYKSLAGSGNVSYTDIQLRWNYSSNGLPDDVDIDIKVLGTEMVYVPQGAFQAGDNGTAAYCYKQGSADTDPWNITSENAINCTSATTDGNYYTSSGKVGEQATGSTFTIPAAYPKGFNAFYIMKYEMSQEQYRDFLNLLTRTQQQSRIATDISGTSITSVFVMANSSSPSVKNGICCSSTIPATGPVTFYCDGDHDASYNEDNDNQNLPLNYIYYPDLAAYADWAGLRPMTELEYEKACRGTHPAINGEYVWGNTSLFNSIYSIINYGTATESISLISFGTGTGNALYQATMYNGPIRCGIFAYSSPNHTRQETGSTYYGVMEMSGNVLEVAVSSGCNAGYTFTGLNGDGSLNSSGDANTDFWPGMGGNNLNANASTAYGGTIGVTGKAGMGDRGGAYGTNYAFLQVSDRTYNCSLNLSSSRAPGIGCRLVRTMP